MSSLKYTDETDRAYALSGMGVAMFMLEKEQYLHSITLDLPTPGGLVISSDFFYTPNQQLSAKAVWNAMLSQFYTVVSLSLANVMARSLVRARRELPPSLLAELRRELSVRGGELCQLEPDEVSNLMNRALGNLDSLFRYPEVHTLIRTLASELTSRRTLTADDLSSRLSPYMR